MSFYDYKISREIKNYDSFSAYIMAAIRQAMYNEDERNQRVLRKAFPEIHLEFWRRYSSPGGKFPGESEKEGIKQLDPGEHINDG